MKRTIATIAIAGALVATAACGNDDAETDVDNDTTSEVTMQTPTTTAPNQSSTVESTDDLGRIDQAKLATFVVAFRTGYSELAQDRDDASIEEIVLESCQDIAAGADEQQVTEEIRNLAAHNGNEPTMDQAERIYDMVTPACP
ncbi:hypothetical protein [Rhodococcus sp. ARC_M6]|uniref:hypothetical protein n=1 Tax=Rhodococcus sp. ARC_M6 TaxID=2928852 RepID=UPI001FB3C73A|nr:hypothetical protein [Rhodococcus sp. ARC_M6]MCJ0902579.1 hypothetical protein [Rhodococcus sp. ARC_M6]